LDVINVFSLGFPYRELPDPLLSAPNHESAAFWKRWEDMEVVLAKELMKYGITPEDNRNRERNGQPGGKSNGSAYDLAM
jgi:hypothetical protein